MELEIAKKTKFSKDFSILLCHREGGLLRLVLRPAPKRAFSQSLKMLTSISPFLMILGALF